MDGCKIFMLDRKKKGLNTYKTNRILDAFFLVVCLIVYFNIQPSSQNVIIDESEQVIKIQRQYFFKSDENILILFNEIDHIIYRSDLWLDCPVYTVEVVKIDKTKILIKKSVLGARKLRDSAETIAKASGKRLKQECIT